MSAWGWLALSLGLLSLVIWGAVFVIIYELAKRYKPMLDPLLGMFTPQPATSMRCDFGVKNISGGTDLCTLPAGHTGYHTFRAGAGS